MTPTASSHDRSGARLLDPWFPQPTAHAQPAVSVTFTDRKSEPRIPPSAHLTLPVVNPSARLVGARLPGGRSPKRRALRASHTAPPPVLRVHALQWSPARSGPGGARGAAEPVRSVAAPRSSTTQDTTPGRTHTPCRDVRGVRAYPGAVGVSGMRGAGKHGGGGSVPGAVAPPTGRSGSVVCAVRSDELTHALPHAIPPPPPLSRPAVGPPPPGGGTPPRTEGAGRIRPARARREGAGAAARAPRPRRQGRTDAGRGQTPGTPPSGATPSGSPKRASSKPKACRMLTRSWLWLTSPYRYPPASS